MSKSELVYIGLGSNLGDRADIINKALKMLSETSSIQVASTSDIIETSSLGDKSQPDYLNTVAQINTTLSAENLLAKLADIETTLGRVRGEKWSPRTIDLDLLLFGNQIIKTPGLTIPHPQMHLRSFVLKGLCQLNADLLHPVLNEAMSELAARLGGADFVLNPKLPQLISIAGVIGVGKTTLTKSLAKVLVCETLFEPYDENPFMPDVYAGKKQLALDSEFYFLKSRAEQLSPKSLKSRRIYIADYIHDKSLIYAKYWLNSQQLAEYEKTYQPVLSKVVKPMLVIYLQDSPQSCLERIHKRGRPYEQNIHPDFLESLKSDYQQLFAHWKTCPVIRISISKKNYTKQATIKDLANQVKRYIVA